MNTLRYALRLKDGLESGPVAPAREGDDGEDEDEDEDEDHRRYPRRDERRDRDGDDDVDGDDDTTPAKASPEAPPGARQVTDFFKKAAAEPEGVATGA